MQLAREGASRPHQTGQPVPLDPVRAGRHVRTTKEALMMRPEYDPDQSDGAPAQDEGDENPDNLAGEEVADDLIDPSDFAEVDDDAEEDA